jgi:G3E family GTPase
MAEGNRLMPAPFYMVTGFLGGGKTTLLKRFINFYADDVRLGIVQNEFAPLNVDGEELRLLGKPFHLLEINRGSVFCVCLLADFVTSLAQFVDDCRPQFVFLEASGVADPLAVAELLAAPQLQSRLYLARIWCIVDAVTFFLLEKNNLRITHQVRAADVVIINKTDLADAPRLAEVEARVHKINPAAKVVASAFCVTDLKDLLADEPSLIGRDAATLAAEALSERPKIGTAVVKTARKISRPQLDAFLTAQAPTAFRIKGFVQVRDGAPLQVQSVGGRTQILPTPDYVGITQLIAVGPEVQQQEFARQFREMILA